MGSEVTNITEAIEFAVNDLSKKLGLSPNLVTVKESGVHAWPDASLGMPEPGKMYAQAIAEGFYVVLEACGQKYEYHFGDGIIKTR
jgi:hypothetical protein